jgi:hypothetical protein
MSDQEQWTPGILPSDAKIGTDDPDEEFRQIEGQLVLDDEDDDLSEDEEPAG